MINHALWFQNPTSDKDGVFNIDGIISEYSNTEEQKIVLKIIREAPKWNSLYHFQRKELPNSFELYVKNGKGFLIKSHFLTRDDKNRQITYAFYSADLKNVSVWLKKFAEESKMIMSDDEIALINYTISDYLKFVNNVRMAISALIIVLLIICVYNLFK